MYTSRTMFVIIWTVILIVIMCYFWSLIHKRVRARLPIELEHKRLFYSWLSFVLFLSLLCFFILKLDLINTIKDIFQQNKQSLTSLLWIFMRSVFWFCRVAYKASKTKRENETITWIGYWITYWSRILFWTSVVFLLFAWIAPIIMDNHYIAFLIVSASISFWVWYFIDRINIQTRLDKNFWKN